jgi:hypothetical protein
MPQAMAWKPIFLSAKQATEWISTARQFALARFRQTTSRRNYAKCRVQYDSLKFE